MKSSLFIIVFCFLSINNSSAQCNGGNPSVDIPTFYNYGWSIEDNINAGRRWEESNLGLTVNCLGDLVPPAAGWAALTEVQKAFYILKDERAARGLLPLQGMEANLNSVATAHSVWLINNNRFEHVGNPALGTSCVGATTCSQGTFTGSCFWERINSNPDLVGCSESVGENIGIVTGMNSPLAGLTLYGMMYQDLDCCGWGHRNLFLRVHTNNYGDPTHEGFIGIGMAEGAGYLWPFNTPCQTYFGRILTFNSYDPSAGANCNFDPVPDGCPATLVLSGTIATGTYAAGDIMISGTIPATANVEIIAQNSIEYNGAFEIILGGEMHVKVDVCPN